MLSSFMRCLPVKHIVQGKLVPWYHLKSVVILLLHVFADSIVQRMANKQIILAISTFLRNLFLFFNIALK